MTTKSRLVSLRTGWSLVALAIAGVVVAAVVLVGSVGSAVRYTFFRDSCPTPCAEELELDTGRYVVFERTGESATLGPVTTSRRGPTTISPEGVSVTGPSGEDLEVVWGGSSETITRNGTTYTGVVAFRVPSSGRYRVQVDAPTTTRVLVAPGIGETFADAVPGLAVAGLAGVFGVVGVTILIVALVRRNDRSRSPRAPGS